MKIFQQLVESASTIRDLRSTQSFVRIMLVLEVATFSHLQPFFEHLTYYQGFAQTIQFFSIFTNYKLRIRSIHCFSSKYTQESYTLSKNEVFH